ncbi:hypothetical protein PGT21_001035 [Puccinia graminis f. sp. tritici]|uniref:Uncharacterized protein n=1 Tax=Puccinia graminis f. sp. tritici TaxID=56615 RepID=A0A5B0MWS1_PUCGR|nr:hypothetical protein PGT21_001035 [Puccinia graminis f. sp. tritici]KAA1090345.1 hypothetical protein PGTUg99_003881 [Puccinia graminis f. sp. tritici]
MAVYELLYVLARFSHEEFYNFPRIFTTVLGDACMSSSLEDSIKPRQAPAPGHGLVVILRLTGGMYRGRSTLDFRRDNKFGRRVIVVGPEPIRLPA